MKANCKNCNTSLIGAYCHNCSQPKDTHKINIQFLWHDIQHGLLHVDNGILFTSKELFIRPGHTIRAFIEGKRVKHFKPLSLVIVLAGFYGFISHYFDINLLSNNISVNGSGEQYDKIKEIVNNMSNWIASHYSLFSLLQIPLFTIGTYFSFKKVGYNFIEHLVINTFLTGQRLLLHIITFPLYYIFNNSSFLRTTARVVDSIGFILFMWAIYQLFNMLVIKQRLFRTVLSFVIIVLINFAIISLIFKLAIHSIK